MGGMNSKILTVIFFMMLTVLYFGSLDRIVLTDPDEVFYSQTAKEMIEADSLWTPVMFGLPQFEKPPLFYWLLIGSFKTLGVTPLAARLAPALFGFLGVLLTFYFCRRVFDQEVAYFSSIILATSGLYLGLSKAVLTDIVLSVCMTAAFYAFYLWFLERKEYWLYAYAVAAGLAVLTKGPVAIVILGAVCVLFLVIEKEFGRLKAFVFHPWVLVFAAVCCPWYIDMIAKYGRVFTDEFFINDNWRRIVEAEHSRADRWHFYPMIMTVALFPWIFYLAFLGRRVKAFKREHIFLAVWVAVTFLIFQCAHSKLASYILPLWPAWVILIGVSLSSMDRGSRRLKVLAIIYALLGLALWTASFIVPGKFPAYVWPAALIAIRAFAVSFLIGAVFLWKEKLAAAVVSKAMGIVVLFILGGLAIPDPIEREVTDLHIRKIVEEQNYQGLPIVTGKLFARGVHFYTGNPVVVYDEREQPFWSKHPILVVAKDAGIKEYMMDKDRVLLVLKRSFIHDLNRVFRNTRRNTIIEDNGTKIVVISEKIKDQ